MSSIGKAPSGTVRHGTALAHINCKEKCSEPPQVNPPFVLSPPFVLPLLRVAAMNRLTAVALIFFVLFTSVLPLALARETKRETNADRFRRGAPPLPPTRRDSANRPDPSSKPPTT
jgi:hypothetical protein